MSLSKKYPFFRQIRGDGNCFYRAFGCLYIENLITESLVDLGKSKKHKISIFLKELKNPSFSLIKLNNCYNPNLIPILMKNNNLKETLINNVNFLSKIKRELESFEDLSQEQKIDFFRKKITILFNEKPLFDMAVVIYIRTKINQIFIDNQANPEYEPFFYDYDEK